MSFQRIELRSALPPIVLGLLTGMDVQGEQILGTYLRGGGKAVDVFDDPIWTDYMMENEGLRRQVFGQLILSVRDLAARKKKGRFSIAETFHAECPENSGFSGYALLHGTNRTVGDFKLTGWADVQDAVDPGDGALDIDLDLRFVFNDIVDPNANYLMDQIRSAVATAITFGEAKSYRLSIHWSSSCLAEFRQGKPIVFSGYPSDRPRVVRPLPRSTLDLVSLERNRAKEIETKIIQQLRRNIPARDITSLADRKRRLLWMFYGLSGYMRPTYLDRFSRAASDDELPRLVRERLSSELRTELMGALRGTRPHGVEPS
jgi:hypothetical protein